MPTLTQDEIYQVDSLLSGSSISQGRGHGGAYTTPQRG